jgi:hypothetical protein
MLGQLSNLGEVLLFLPVSSDNIASHLLQPNAQVRLSTYKASQNIRYGRFGIETYEKNSKSRGQSQFEASR